MSTEHIKPAIVSPSKATEPRAQEYIEQDSAREEIAKAQEQKLRWNWRDALFILILLLLIVGMAYRYTRNITGEVPGMWWDPLLNTWAMAWDTTALLHNPLHLWQAPLLYPNNLTLSYTESLFGNVIFFAPVFLLTHNPVLAYNVTFYLTFFLCGLNMYIVARHYTQKRFAAFVAALIYAFAPYRLAQIDHIPVTGGEWIPLAFLYLDKSFQEGRWRHWILFALFYVLQLLSSVYYGIFLAYTLLAYLLIRYSIPFLKQWRQRGREYLISLSKLVVRPAIVFGAMLILLVILLEPYLVSLHNGYARSVIQTVGYSAFLRDFLFTAPFNKLYGIAYFNGETIPLDGEHFLFLGWTIMALTVLGVILAFRRRNTAMQAYAWTGLVVLLFAFGPYLQYSAGNGAPLPGGTLIAHPFPPAIPMPWLIAFHILPGFKGLRVPSRLIGVLLMMLALLGAYVVAWIQDALATPAFARSRANNSQGTGEKPQAIKASPFKSIALGCILTIIPLALLAEALPAYLPVTHVPVGNTIPAVYEWLATHGGSQPIVELPMSDAASPFGDKNEAWYDYYTIYHPHPIANGWSGYRPANTMTISHLMLHFPSQASIAILKRYHIQYVVFHAQLVSQFMGSRTVSTMLTQMQASPDLHLVAAFGRSLSTGDSVWQVI